MREQGNGESGEMNVTNKTLGKRVCQAHLTYPHKRTIFYRCLSGSYKAAPNELIVILIQCALHIHCCTRTSIFCRTICAKVNDVSICIDMTCEPAEGSCASTVFCRFSCTKIFKGTKSSVPDITSVPDVNLESK